MGKIRPRTLGLEDLEIQQKEDQKKRSAEKKAAGASKGTEKGIEKSGDAKSSAVSESKKEDEKKPAVKKSMKSSEKSAKKGKAHPRSKKYKEAAAKVDAKKTYKVKDAVALLKKIAFAKFPESVELHMNVVKTGLKGEVELPHATGKTVRVKILDDATLDKIAEGKIEFDVLIAHPSYMPKIARFAKVLGPKGLMPNPKTGTVSANPEEVAKKFEKGTMQWKTEAKAPVIHQMVAKLSSEEKQIEENVIAFMNVVGKVNISDAFIKTTMSPSLKLDMSELN